MSNDADISASRREAILVKARAVRSMPGIVEEVRRLIRDPEVKFEELAALIE